MATASHETQTFDQKHHFLLRKLHSLSGIIPIGAFLIEHLLTNSLAFAGPERFNKAVHGIHELPWLLALEVFGIFLPLAFINLWLLERHEQRGSATQAPAPLSVS